MLFRPGIVAPEKAVGEAELEAAHLFRHTRHATAHPLLSSIVFGTMPHVAAYGILLVQALFFFLGGNGYL